MEYEMGDQFVDDGLDKQRKKSAIKKKAIKFTKIISLVGLRHATDSRNSAPRRFVWLVWVVFGLVFAVYQIQGRIDYYLKYPSRSEVKFVTDETSILFPQVTICEDNPEPYPEKLIVQIDDQLKKMKEAETKKEEGQRNASIKEMIDLLDQLHNETRNWNEVSKEHYLSADKAVVQVEFNTQENKSLYEKVITDLGHCFAFSTVTHSLNLTKGGIQNGLILKLNASVKGFKMYIDDPKVIPKVKHDGITLRKGTVTRVAVSLESVTYPGEPYDNCNKDAPDYRLVNCLKACDYELFSMQCGCRDIHMTGNGTGNGTVCSYANILNCTKYFGKQESANSSSVECRCGPQCNTLNYKTSITQTTFSQYESTVHLYVYFQHFAYMKVNNVPAYSFLELLCEIGGALSLLLGATLLTVYEAIEFFLLFIRDYLQMRLAK